MLPTKLFVILFRFSYDPDTYTTLEFSANYTAVKALLHQKLLALDNGEVLPWKVFHLLSFLVLVHTMNHT